MRIKAVLFSSFFFLLLWLAASVSFGSLLVPPPSLTLIRSFEIFGASQAWVEVGLTLGRGLAGLVLSFLAALILGIPAGFSKKMMTLTGPLVAALQSCPAIVWIIMLMVYWGVGSSLPVAVVTAALFPPLFANIAQGVSSLDRRLLAVARLYHVPKTRILYDLVLPSLRPFLLAGLSFALGAVWRVVTMAEFLGAARGVGARIYWSYRVLDMPALFSWAGLVVLWGLVLEWGLVRSLRLRMERLAS